MALFFFRIFYRVYYGNIIMKGANNMDQIKEKAKNLKEKAEEKVKNVKTKVDGFLNSHPELIFPIMSVGVSVFLGGISAVAKAASPTRNLENCTVEDDATGLEFRTIHPMTNAEILELSERMEGGQTKGNALNEMGLLKNEKKRR